MPQDERRWKLNNLSCGVVFLMTRGEIGWNAEHLEGQPPVGSQTDSWTREKNG